ncbi:hypothetical protein FVEN_g229 [Fusarium venenatum]|uniref:Cullin N-terminal domain-containing protein n=2 Tax=Fusarium venenatum TaxID=56646 RepID=A0A2L2SYT9_9HYPO|nr:uncharacterized protein FVRRES_07668 [Fusarium venenatum]KAG8362256.1 hypothetical protein FVEN_g229 [Fusarium venenatum]CEI63232.1 unnamed protein product [Fusarium venenatum]
MAEGTAPAEGQRMPDASDIEALRAFLMNGVASIHQNPEAKMTPSTYMDLYTAVSKLIVGKKFEDGELLGKDIYNDVSKFLAEHLESVKFKIICEDESLRLGTYFAEWDRYVSSATKVDRILNLLNRHYILRHTSEGRKGFYPIRLLHFVKWRTEVWEELDDWIIICVQRAVEKKEENVGRVYDMIRDFQERRVDSHSISWKESISKSFHLPFVFEVEKLEREVDEIAAGLGNNSSHCVNNLAAARQ